MTTLERALRWDGCANVRDLGGHRTEDGGETRFRRIVRADNIRRLSDAGWESLVAYGVRTVVDLRFPSELDADPPRELPVEAVHVPLFDELEPDEWAEIDALAEAQPDAAGATRAVYLEFLERFRPNFARALATVATAPEGAVLVHCHGGKDRTGLVTALLLRLAGVAPEDVATDYALSEQNLVRLHEPWFAAAEDERELERRRRIAASPYEAMLGVLADLERCHGSAREYLSAAGASEADLDRARARLLA